MDTVIIVAHMFLNMMHVSVVFLLKEDFLTDVHPPPVKNIPHQLKTKFSSYSQKNIRES